MAEAPIEVWQSSDEACQVRVCMNNGNEAIAQRALASACVFVSG